MADISALRSRFFANFPKALSNAEIYKKSSTQVGLQVGDKNKIGIK